MPEIQDIFGAKIARGQSWKMDSAVLTIDEGTDLIVSSVQIQYQRPVQRFVPLNNNKISMITGRGSGTLQLGIIVGPKDSLSAFVTKFADPCSQGDRTITIKPTSTVCDENGGAVTGDMQFVCNWCLINGLTANVQNSGDLAVIQGGVALMIGALTFKSGGGKQ